MKMIWSHQQVNDRKSQSITTFFAFTSNISLLNIFNAYNNSRVLLWILLGNRAFCYHRE